MDEFQIHFQKKFGQNFLINPTVPKRIAAYAARGVLEIGPGIGTLTRELCQTAEKVVAVEIDRGLIPVLEKTLGEFENVKILNQDILKVNLPALIQEEFGDLPVSVCANLPYYITTDILMALLESKIPFASITVMVQKEFAQRICAGAGTADYGAITASVSYYARAEKLFDVPPGNFVPAPKVTSSVLMLTPYQTPPVTVTEEAMLFAVIRAAFAQRRKTLQNALSTAFPKAQKERLANCIVAAGYAPSIRGEMLPLSAFAALANALTKAGISCACNGGASSQNSVENVKKS